MRSSLHLEMAVLDAGKQADQDIDHSLEPVGLIAGYVDSFGPADAYMLDLKAYEDIAAGLRVHTAAGLVSEPGGGKLASHNLWFDKGRQLLAVELGKGQELCSVVAA
jgi:hypothetical protein